MKQGYKVIIIMLFSFVFVASLVAHAASPGKPDSAAETAQTTGKADKPKLEGKRIIGTVAAVDMNTRTLTVKNWRGETLFDAGTARFARHTGLQDIVPGERVLVRYVEEDGKKVAKAVVTARAKSEKGESAGPGEGVTGSSETPEKR